MSEDKQSRKAWIEPIKEKRKRTGGDKKESESSSAPPRPDEPLPSTDTIQPDKWTVKSEREIISPSTRKVMGGTRKPPSQSIGEITPKTHSSALTETENNNSPKNPTSRTRTHESNSPKSSDNNKSSDNIKKSSDGNKTRAATKYLKNLKGQVGSIKGGQITGRIIGGESPVSDDTSPIAGYNTRPPVTLREAVVP